MLYTLFAIWGINNNTIAGICFVILIFFTFTPLKYFGRYNHNDKFPIKSANA